MKTIINFFKYVLLFPVLPLMILYIIYSIYLLYKNDGPEFEIIIEKDELIEHIKGSEFEKFTKTYVIPILITLAIIAWFYIIKYIIYGN